MKHLVKTLLTTHPNIGSSIARLTLGLVIFPHGAQKLLGLFGGNGFSATMDFFTTQMGLPSFVAFSISKFWALSLAGMFMGIIYTTQLEHGFFMNWFGNQAGEGYEYSLLVIGLALTIMVNGSGKWSIDKLISKKQ